MSDGRRQLNFKSEDDAIAEIDRLRVGGYAQRKNWTLPMICWHLGAAGSPKPPASSAPTPEQADRKRKFIDVILREGRPPTGFEAPPHITPKADCGDDAVLKFRQVLKELRDYTHALVDFGPFGPVSTDEVRKLTLMHAGHHLSFLDPKQSGTRRSRVSYASEDDVINDVKRLRHGYKQAGSWNLPQVCAHLDKAVQFRMQPGPFAPDTPEQAKNKEKIPGILAAGTIPEGIKAPEPMLPPADCGEASIDAFLVTIEKYKRFPGPTAPHRIFGMLEERDARKLNLIHCAHHLSYLTPTN